MTTHRNNSAFTIIELLLALALVATVLTTLYATWTATSTSVRKGQLHLDHALQARSALNTLTQQLRCTVPQPLDPSDKTETKPSHPDNLLCSFLTTTPLASKGHASLLRSDWRLDPRTHTLSCRQTSPTTNPHDAPDTWHPIASNVQSLSLRFLTHNTWQPTWPTATADNQTLPAAVEITLTLASHSLTSTYTTTVAIDTASFSSKPEQIRTAQALTP